MTELAHSPLGPSAADRWINCPGSHLAGLGKPDRPSRYAAEGSAAHTLAHLVYTLDAPAISWKGHTFEQDGYAFKVGKPMYEGVQQFHEWCMKDPGKHYSEVRVYYEDWVPGGFGTSDRITVTRRTGYARDLKFGTGHKVAPDTAQLKLYALGTYVKLRDTHRLQKFVLGIGQPRLRYWDEVEISVKDLLDWADDVAFPAALKALTPGQPRKAGDWCSFCRIRDTCSVRAEYKREVGKVKNAALVNQHFSAID